MSRIAIIDRADMNAEQARVYDTAKETSGIVGGPYYAYIRLPKLFEACQNLRGALANGTQVIKKRYRSHHRAYWALTSSDLIFTWTLESQRIPRTKKLNA